MEITQGSSKAGGMAVTETSKPTMFSNVFTPSSLKNLTSVIYAPSTSQVLRILPTDPPGANFPTAISSFRAFPSLYPLSHSSPTSSTSQTANLETLTSLSLMMNPPIADAIMRQNNEPMNNTNLKTTLSTKPSRKLLTEPRFNCPLSDATSSITATSSRSNPHPYSPNLNPKPSTLRPHCFAKDRLRMWIPSSPSSRSTPSSSNQLSADINPNISDDQLNRILDVISASWAEKTKETYGSGLLIFHVFCDLQNITEDHHCPASPSLISSFLASCAGAYLGSALSNCTAGLRAWHLLHRQPWNINQNELHSILEGASRLAPSSSK
jgi:hypothetical protein